ncbi:beta-1,3-glucanase family protein [Ideonella sp. DXS29W]|uniref:Beta-1,3-glucanase family protein n=1 Tax=Ideonella lacteola TaxID=2984193 RepID=A0ABU9BY79_9BURK
MKRWMEWLVVMMTSWLLLLSPARAQTSDDYTQGVVVAGNTATIWFSPTSSQTTWVDLHYKVNDGPQQNLGMTWVSGNTRFEKLLRELVTGGDVLTYSFTYNKGTPAYDTPVFTFTVGNGGPNTVAKPSFSPSPGSYSAAQTVTLATTTDGAVIHYTLDGSKPTPKSPVYSTPLSISKTTTIKARAYKDGLTKSTISKGTYTLTKGNVATPVFNPAGGNYASAQTVTISSATPGAVIKYTTDGSAPTAASPTYAGPIAVASSKTLRAVAQKTGYGDSGVETADYAIGVGTWNKMTTFNVLNGTRGAWRDDQIYWAIIGRDWNTDQFVHVDASGNLVPMQLSDNGALMKNGKPYSNYFYTLAQTRSITIPPINSARLMLSVGSPMYISINVDVNGKIAYAGANIENPDDPNIDVTFDFVEMAIVPTLGFFGNTTRVDQFGFPVKMRVQGLGGYDRTVGETETREALFTAFQTKTPSEFRSLAQEPYAPYRIMAPAHGTFRRDGPHAHYLDTYIADVWKRYTTQTLTFTNAQGTFTGKVNGGRFEFSDGQGTYIIARAPTTEEAFLGNGVLNDPTGTAPGTPAYDKQLQIQAQMCAAINRHIVEDPEHWSNSSYFYAPGQPANWFAKFWHDHSIVAQSYGFPYDDVWNYSSSLHTPAPTIVDVTVGW